MASPSLVIFMRSSSGIQSLGLIFLVVANWFLCLIIPKGIISVFFKVELGFGGLAPFIEYPLYYVYMVILVEE